MMGNAELTVSENPITLFEHSLTTEGTLQEYNIIKAKIQPNLIINDVDGNKKFYFEWSKSLLGNTIKLYDASDKHIYSIKRKNRAYDFVEYVVTSEEEEGNQAKKTITCHTKLTSKNFRLEFTNATTQTKTFLEVVSETADYSHNIFHIYEGAKEDGKLVGKLDFNHQKVSIEVAPTLDFILAIASFNLILSLKNNLVGLIN